MVAFVAQIRGHRRLLTGAVTLDRAAELIAEHAGAWVVEAPDWETAYAMFVVDPRVVASLRQIADRRAFRAIGGRYDLLDYQQLRALRAHLAAELRDQPATRLQEIADAFGIHTRPAHPANYAVLLAETLAAEQRELAHPKEPQP